jgi:hypothetical protein
MNGRRVHDIVVNAVTARVQPGHKCGARWAAVGRRAKGIVKIHALLRECDGIGCDTRMITVKYRALFLVGHVHKNVRSHSIESSD